MANFNFKLDMPVGYLASDHKIMDALFDFSSESGFDKPLCVSIDISQEVTRRPYINEHTGKLAYGWYNVHLYRTVGSANKLFFDKENGSFLCYTYKSFHDGKQFVSVAGSLSGKEFNDFISKFDKALLSCDLKSICKSGSGSLSDDAVSRVDGDRFLLLNKDCVVGSSDYLTFKNSFNLDYFYEHGFVPAKYDVFVSDKARREERNRELEERKKLQKLDKESGKYVRLNKKQLRLLYGVLSWVNKNCDKQSSLSGSWYEWDDLRKLGDSVLTSHHMFDGYKKIRSSFDLFLEKAALAGCPFLNRETGSNGPGHSVVSVTGVHYSDSKVKDSVSVKSEGEMPIELDMSDIIVKKRKLRDNSRGSM